MFKRVLTTVSSITIGILGCLAAPAWAQLPGDTAFWTSSTTLGNDPVTFNVLGYGMNPANSPSANLVALNNVVAACNAAPSGCRVFVPAGSYNVGGSVNPFTTSAFIYGASSSQVSDPSARGSILSQTTAGTTLFTFQSTGIVSDLVFGGGATALKFEHPSSSGLSFQSSIVRCSFIGQTGIAVNMENQAWYVIRDNVWNGVGVTGSSAIGLMISAPHVPDVDQGTITGNLFTIQGFAAIYWISGGGTRIVDNKILTAQLSTTGIYIDPAAGVRTGDIFIIGNSIESDISKYGVYIDSSHSDTALQNITINDNQFGGFSYAQVQLNSPQLFNAIIVGNAFINTPLANNIALGLVGVSGAYVGDNLFNSQKTGTTTAIYVASGASDVTIGTNRFIAMTNPLISGSTTTSVKGLTESTFANLPAAVNGSMLYCSDCIVASTCTGAGTGAFAKRLNGVWSCN
jgi:hypothetical protein